VRAVVTDPAGRLLLVRFVGFPEGDLWATPGGGIEPCETPESAIRRELREEVGLLDAVIGPPIWHRTHLFSSLPQFGGQEETFFLVRFSGRSAPPAFSAEELLAEGLSGSRWWSLAELRTAKATRFAPQNLPELYHSLLDSGPPRDPIETGE
jgi:8-oxo-dGTP pyrophosphatase MutT (NUDIX family)